MTDTLTAEDRCDKCRAQAHVRVDLECGELIFCWHHARKYGFVEELVEVTRG